MSAGGAAGANASITTLPIRHWETNFLRGIVLLGAVPAGVVLVVAAETVLIPVVAAAQVGKVVVQL